LVLEGTIKNNGALSITNVQLNVNIFNNANLVYSQSSLAIDTLDVGNSQSRSVTSYVPTDTGQHIIQYFVTINETDGNPGNDSTGNQLFISDSTFARDDNVLTGTLGLGAGTSGELGQMFTLNRAARLTSVSFYIGNTSDQMVNQPISVNIYDYDSEPTTLLGTTDTITVTQSGGHWIDIPVHGGPLALDTGIFVTTVVEGDSTITLGYANNNFINGVTWVIYGANPWRNNEDYGFDNVYLLRPNFGRTTLAQFTEMTDIAFTGLYNSSVSWGDYDNDGDLDLMLTGQYNSSDYASKLYRNEGANQFIEMDSIGFTGVHNGSAAWGDYDNDGDLDLILTGFDNSWNLISKLYRNDPAPAGDQFSEMTGAAFTGVFYSSIAWGDYDNDGDLDLMLTGRDKSNVNVSKLYRNEGSDQFSEITGIGFTGVRFSSIAWADYDNDGDLDLMLTGQNNSNNPVSELYRNEGSDQFAEMTSIGFTDVETSSVAWGDYNNDGDLDLILTGFNGSAYVSELYRNEGADQFSEMTGMVFTGIRSGAVAWGDYDNDGDLDLILTGEDNSTDPQSKIYRNEGNDQFIKMDTIAFTDVLDGAVSWGDYDNDGDLDLMLTGYTNSSPHEVSKLYRNENGTSNNAPNAPANLQAVVSNDSTQITFSWDMASDTESPDSTLTYNLRVGTSTNDVDVVSPMSFTEPDSTGKRKIAALGSQNHNTAWMIEGPFNGFQIPSPFYWNVQSIDNNFSGSGFATEQTVDLGATAWPELNNDAVMTPTDRLYWETDMSGYITGFQVQIDDSTGFSNPEVDDTIHVSTSKTRSQFYSVTLNELNDYGTLIDDARYYWRMRPVYSVYWTSGVLYTDGTASFIFNKENDAPNPPVSGFSPADNETINTLKPTISWFAASDPDTSDHAGSLHYILNLSDTSGFFPIIVNDTTEDGVTYITLTSALNHETTYYYRVKTVDDEGAESVWSTTQIFQTYEMPIDLLLQNIIIDTGQTETYQARNSITAAGDTTYFIVEGNDSTRGNATFEAGNLITLNYGFDAKDGSLFEANIDTNLVENKAEGGHKHMTIIPVPGENGIFILRLNIGEGEVAVAQIFDKNDKWIYENKQAGAKTKIDLSSQPKGTYTVKVWFGEILHVEEINIE